MSSPGAHSIIGLAIGMARFLPHAADTRELARQIWHNRAPLFICIILANAPDIDYLFGIPRGNLNFYHHTITHTVVWIFMLSVALWCVGWPSRSMNSFLFVLLLSGSHLLLDFVTAHGPGSHGMMIGWPLSTQSCISSISIFPSPAKSSFRELLTLHNLRVIIIEVLITLPFVAAVVLYKTRKRSSRSL